MPETQIDRVTPETERSQIVYDIAKQEAQGRSIHMQSRDSAAKTEEGSKTAASSSQIASLVVRV